MTQASDNEPADHDAFWHALVRYDVPVLVDGNPYRVMRVSKAITHDGILEFLYVLEPV